VSEQAELPLAFDDGLQEERDDESDHFVDEHGEHDEFDTGGVYDRPGGEFLLEPTKELLAERFALFRSDLPEQVGPFERVDVPERNEGIEARYETREEFETVVRIFPRGPSLHAWTVAITEYVATPRDAPPEDQWRGSGSKILEGASDLYDPSDAIEAAVEFMERSE